MSTKIITANLEHINECAYLFNEYRVFYEQESNLNGARNFLRERLENFESKFLLAEVEEKFVGFINLYPTFSSVSMQHTYILNDLFVLPDFRNQRVAQTLMKHVQSFAKETGAKGLALATAQDNRMAQSLYESLGYKCDEFLHYYLNV